MCSSKQNEVVLNGDGKWGGVLHPFFTPCNKYLLYVTPLSPQNNLRFKEFSPILRIEGIETQEGK